MNALFMDSERQFRRPLSEPFLPVFFMLAGQEATTPKLARPVPGYRVDRRAVLQSRALLLDTPILVLDEPTEGLDTVTEQAVLQAVDKVMRGRSVLLITQRPSALVGMVGQVLEFDEGRIVRRDRARMLLSPDINTPDFHGRQA
ncbi:MAG: hypothetical protein RXR20_17770 [Paraburkholderia sp.]|uniref:hypothetical protein n=1 Tax=Paraburkholderia sp. TaxID=1926495 RepID=UPI003979427D